MKPSFRLYAFITILLYFFTPLRLYTSTFLYAKEVTLDFINSKPKSIYRDYYIWRYLNQRDINSSTAIKLLGKMKRVNLRRFLRFAKKIDDPAYKKILKCYKMLPLEFTKSDADCIKIGLSAYDMTKLDKKSLLKVKKIVESIYPKQAKLIDIFLSDLPFEALLDSDEDTFFDLFNRVGSNFREKKLNQFIPKNYIERLTKNKRFNYSIKLIVTNPKLTALQLSLLDINSSSLNAKANFYLFLNALKYRQKSLALSYLKIAEDKFYYRFDKDKCIFWRYLATKEKKALKKLSKSVDKNIYSLYALEILKENPKNIISDLKCKQAKPKIDITDPFEWLKVLNKLNKKDTNATKIARNFKSCDELPYKAFALERANYKNSYFIMPYKRYLKNYTKDEIALILAIARQESRFIPPSISTSYALGMMQFMPFLAKATAKELKIKNFDTDEMFKPKIAYKFAYKHIKYLKRKLKHPLLVAYAYNGGIGFTRRMLKKGLFKNSEYEPFYSLEIVPYDESKRYAKKVLANYVIYKNLLGEKVSIIALLQSLIEPYSRKSSQK